jgi:XTP/dITP diphosphohydrolase
VTGGERPSELVIASANRKKAAEIAGILRGFEVRLRTLDEFPDLKPVVENAPTFEGNAVKKALAAARATGLPALADDSGLEVEALGGAPGVFSARYAGEGADDEANNARLLGALREVPADRRGARFRCVIAVALPDGEVRTAEGSCEGLILEAPRGEGGFGYDPLFFHPPLGLTFAELDPSEKRRVSHRGKALDAARELISWALQVK